MHFGVHTIDNLIALAISTSVTYKKHSSTLHSSTFKLQGEVPGFSLARVPTSWGCHVFHLPQALKYKKMGACEVPLSEGGAYWM